MNLQSLMTSPLDLEEVRYVIAHQIRLAMQQGDNNDSIRRVAIADARAELIINYLVAGETNSTHNQPEIPEHLIERTISKILPT